MFNLLLPLGLLGVLPMVAGTKDIKVLFVGNRYVRTTAKPQTFLRLLLRSFFFFPLLLFFFFSSRLSYHANPNSECGCDVICPIFLWSHVYETLALTLTHTHSNSPPIFLA